MLMLIEEQNKRAELLGKKPSGSRRPGFANWPLFAERPAS